MIGSKLARGAFPFVVAACARPSTPGPAPPRADEDRPRDHVPDESIGDAHREGRRLLEEHLAVDADRYPLPTDTPEIVAIVEAHATKGWLRLDGALALALRGDRRAMPVLRRALSEPLSSSGIEAGLAAVGLALLGDAESRDAIAAVQPMNGNAARVSLALRILDR